ncbi:hypothetical protein [Streptomyces arenae]|uniref:hypothetical protein n=1 Tax=Streptomyces arenae TaxID=29301 RepID=UPI002659A983|nr:hypothetical protein [Streptomyces arenae]MCG7208199.1 hypothetical protein [Streptomyces arenae]
MTPSPTERVQLPIYEDLVRERGDVVAEARQAADHTQHQAAELLGAENVPGGPVHHRPVG